VDWQISRRTPVSCIARMTLSVPCERTRLRSEAPAPSVTTTASCPATARAVASASRASPAMRVRWGWSRASRPGLRAKAVTAWPSASSASTAWRPTAPVAPKTLTFMSDLLEGAAAAA
jgi:hypothetical protein